MKGVINGAGWKDIKTAEDFDFLKTVVNESKGTRHKPLQHSEAIGIFNDRLVASNVVVKEQYGMLSPNQQKFIYMTKVGDQQFSDLDFFLGFLSFNDKSRAVTNLRGTNVFVCSNLTFSRESMGKKQKHLSHVSDGTASVFDSGIEDFWKYRDERIAQIDRMKEIEIDRNMQGDIILDMMHSNIFGRDPMLISAINKQFEKPIHDEFIDRSLWHFQNAATEEMKKIGFASRLKTDEELDRILNQYMN